MGIPIPGSSVPKNGSSSMKFCAWKWKTIKGLPEEGIIRNRHTSQGREVSG